MSGLRNRFELQANGLTNNLLETEFRQEIQVLSLSIATYCDKEPILQIFISQIHYIPQMQKDPIIIVLSYKRTHVAPKIIMHNRTERFL